MTSIKAGLFLRRGTTVTPGILTFDKSVLTFKTSDSTLFELATNDVHVSFSNYGTITVVNGQDKWDFVAGAYSGAFPPKFSKEQLTELNSGENSISLAAKAKGDAMIYGNNPSRDIAAIVNGGKGYGLGYFSLSDKQRSAFYSNLAFVEYLEANGVQVTIHSKAFSKSQWTIFIVLIASLAVFGVAVFLILSALQN